LTAVNICPQAERAKPAPLSVADGLGLCFALRVDQEASAMDDTLKRLLEAEMRAEKIAQQAESEQEHVIQSAILEARAEEDRFRARIPDLHRSFIKKAEERADQTIAELKRRYDERHVQLRDTAEQREEEALEAAFEVLISPER
jgi:hypothetical protein